MNGKFVLIETKDAKYDVYNDRFKAIIGKLSIKQISIV